MPFAYVSGFLDSGGMRITIAARTKEITRDVTTAAPYMYGVSVMETSRAKNPSETTLKFVATQLASFKVYTFSL